jgi:hypothetical protein
LYHFLIFIYISINTFPINCLGARNKPFQWFQYNYICTECFWHWDKFEKSHSIKGTMALNYILLFKRIYVVTGIENISFESSSFNVKSWHTHKYKLVLPNNNIFKSGQKHFFCILELNKLWLIEWLIDWWLMLAILLLDTDSRYQ